MKYRWYNGGPRSIAWRIAADGIQRRADRRDVRQRQPAPGARSASAQGEVAAQRIAGGHQRAAPGSARDTATAACTTSSRRLEWNRPSLR